MPLASDVFRPFEETHLLVAWCKARFGIDPGVFHGYAFWHRPGSAKFWLASSQCLPRVEGLVESIGILALRGGPPRTKPTSVFLQQFAQTATRNVYVLSSEDALRFVQRETMAVVPVDDGRGYCVVRTEEHVLGCGRIEEDRLVSEIPGAWAKVFAQPLVGRVAPL